MAIEDLQGLGRSHTLSNLVNGGAIWEMENWAWEEEEQVWEEI